MLVVSRTSGSQKLRRLRRFLVCLTTAAALSCAPKAPDERIDRVVAGLSTPIAIKGEPAPRWTITERMSTHRVPGVSVAIVDDGRIMWAEGFGVPHTDKAAE
jgi:hypothetical protein